MNTLNIQSFEYYFPQHTDNIRIRKAYDFLISLPHKKRKYENCSSALHSIRIAQAIIKNREKPHFFMLHSFSCHNQCESEIIISLFHDILEDFPDLSLHHLKKYCHVHELSEIKILTKTPNISYHAYIQNIKTSAIARKIKKLDMLDNLKTANKQQEQKYKKYFTLL